MSQGNGIATLLKAEREAHAIVDEARKYRQDKLKQAQSDAAREVEEYKNAKERELKEQEQRSAGGIDGLEQEAQNRVQGELAEIAELGKTKKNAVVKALVEAVTKPHIELHINATSS